MHVEDSKNGDTAQNVEETSTGVIVFVSDMRQCERSGYICENCQCSPDKNAKHRSTYKTACLSIASPP